MPGQGTWGGLADVNSRSIGIELANPGDRPFPEPQMAALERLLPEIMARWHIPPRGVIAHSDMAPQPQGRSGRAVRLAAAGAAGAGGLARTR